MFLRLWIFFAAVLLRFAVADVAYITFPSDIHWVTRSSEHFDVLYRKGQAKLAARALLAAEKAYRMLSPVFAERPERTWIVLADFQDSLNGYAINVPYSHMVIFASPPQTSGELSALDHWFESVILHEYVHILHLYPAHGLWGLMRSVFGSWVIPNALMPGYFHEGIATFFETNLTEGGRGRGPHFRMYQRMAVHAGQWGHSFLPLDRMDGTTTIFPHGATRYLFGYKFYEYLWGLKGAKGFGNLTRSFSDNWPYFVNLPLQDVYGMGYANLWDSIFKNSEAQFRKEIGEIKSHPLSRLEPLTNSGYSKWDLSLSPDRRFLAFRQRDPENASTLQVMDLQTKRYVHEIELKSSEAEGLCWLNPDGFLYIEPTSESGYSTKILRQFDRRKGESADVTVEGKVLSHVHALSCRGGGKQLLVYQDHGGKGRVLALTATGEREWKIQGRLRLPVGSWVSSLLADTPHWVLLRQGRTTSFLKWSGEARAERVLTVKGHAYQLHGSGSTALTFIADFSGRNEAWAWQTQNKVGLKKIAVLGGISSFEPLGEDFLVSNYEQGGYDIAVARTLGGNGESIPFEPTAPDTDLDKNDQAPISSERTYWPVGSLMPKMWIPSMLVVPDGLQVAAVIPGFDVSQKHSYVLFGGYDTRGLPFADFAYTYRFLSNGSFRLNPFFVPSYLQSSGTFIKRWGLGVGVGGKFPWVDVAWSVTPMFKRVESSALGPAVQSVGVSLGLSKSMGFKSRPLSICPVAGTKLFVEYSKYFKSFGSTHDYFSAVAGGDQYIEAPWWREHVFYLGVRAGYTEGSPLSNEFFEGGGNLLYYQGNASFLNRGFLPGLFFGRRIFSSNLEYRFPLLLVERGSGLFPVFLKRMHAALVGDALTFDLGQAAAGDILVGTRRRFFDRFFFSTGLELKSDWIIGYYVPLQLNLGLYHGFGDFGESLYFTVGTTATL